MKKRRGNPKREIARLEMLTATQREKLADMLVYVGSGHHKTKPADYGFEPPVNPRPWKSICDGLRVISVEEAKAIFRSGILKGMFSSFEYDSDVPKYVWAVDHSGEPYEAKISRGTNTSSYHGYRLEDDDDFRKKVLSEWSRR